LNINPDIDTRVAEQNEEFQKKSVENVQLLSQISDKDNEIESLYERIKQLECKVII